MKIQPWEGSMSRFSNLKLNSIGIAAVGVLFFGLLAGANAFSMPAQVIMIRHAEKPSDGGKGLSDLGWQRARALPSMFNDRAEFKVFGSPAALYAMKPGKGSHSVRPMQTLQFVSEAFQMPVLADYRRYETDDLVAEIKNNRDLDGKMIVICWEHHQLTDIAFALGISPVPIYPDDRFDRVWMANFDPVSGRLLSYRELGENLLPGDTDGLLKCRHPRHRRRH
jgi:hypothetical protein